MLPACGRNSPAVAEPEERAIKPDERHENHCGEDDFPLFWYRNVRHPGNETFARPPRAVFERTMPVDDRRQRHDPPGVS